MVSTPIPSVLELYPEDAATASDADSFITKCEAALSKTTQERKARADAMKNHSWDHRVSQILHHIENDF